MISDEAPSAEIIAMIDTEVLRRIVGPGDYQAAIRILHKIARADQSDADRLIAWMVRAQLRAARVAKAKSDARAAAIGAAKARAKDGE